MKNKHIEKVNKEIYEVIIPIMENWDNYKEHELEYMLKKFGNICRDETSIFRKKILSEKKLSNILLEIGNKYKDNTQILIQIVSSIDNMHDRYGLEISDDVFNFLILNTKNKKVNFYISVFITQLPQFTFYKDKWKYIMSIPDIAPKRKSINTFYGVINRNINNIPIEYKSSIISFFREAICNYNLHVATVGKYEEIIKTLSCSTE